MKRNPWVAPWSLRDGGGAESVHIPRARQITCPKDDDDSRMEFSTDRPQTLHVGPLSADIDPLLPQCM